MPAGLAQLILSSNSVSSGIQDEVHVLVAQFDLKVKTTDSDRYLM